MSRTDPRPHTWKIQGDIPHKQHIAWHRARAQAHYRNEQWDLSFEEFQQIWSTFWNYRGRGSDDYCLSRNDPNGPWDKVNVTCVLRTEHLSRQKLYKLRRNNDHNSSKVST